MYNLNCDIVTSNTEFSDYFLQHCTLVWVLKYFLFFPVWQMFIDVWLLGQLLLFVSVYAGLFSFVLRNAWGWSLEQEPVHWRISPAIQNK